MNHDYKTSKHLTIDKLEAKKKLKLLTSTDLYLKNSTEPFRVSNFELFKLNIRDPVLFISTSFVYVVSHMLTNSLVAFVVLFATLYYLITKHIDSYRSFKLVSKSVRKFSTDDRVRINFLKLHLGFNSDHDLSKDSFDWINRIIRYFWPYLSHFIHFQLNRFFHEEIESGSLARSAEGSKRLFYAILKQFDTNILVIEKFQLGHQPPKIKLLATKENLVTIASNPKQKEELKSKKGMAAKKEIKITEETLKPMAVKSSDLNFVLPKSAYNNEKTLVFDLELDYSGDMNLSVIYKYLCCCSSRMGLEDIFLKFKLRVVVGPITEDVPFIEKVSLTFMDLPKFGYRGIHIVELAELKIVRSVINRLINENILFPKALTIDLSELLRNALDPKAAQAFKEQLAAKEQPGTKTAPQREELTSAQTTGKNNEVSFLTKMMARALLCSCVCSNILVRSCQMQTDEQRDNKRIVKTTKTEQSPR